ncbi:MAG: hypothetical protein QME96_04755, partial [Myxococcota bacterium]|nr:hypothetical protein [Myxococcota bacterium]
WSLRQKGGKVQKPEHAAAAPVLFPYRQARDILSSGAAGARKELLRLALHGTIEGDVVLQFPEDVRESAAALLRAEDGVPPAGGRPLAGTSSPGSIADRLAAAVEEADRRMRECNSEAKRLAAEADAEASRGVDDVPPPAAQAGDAAALRTRLDAAIAEMHDAESAVSSWREEVDRLRREADAPAVGISALRAFRIFLEAHAQGCAPGLEDLPPARCPACGSSVPSIAAARWRAWLAEREGEIEQASAAEVTRAACAQAEAEESLLAWEEESRTRQGALVDARTMLAVTLARAQAGAQAISRARTATVSDLQGRALGRQAQAETYRRVKARASEIMEDMLTAEVRRLAREIDEYLPPGWACGIRVRDQDRKVCDVGLLRPVPQDGDYYRTPDSDALHLRVEVSDGELVALTCALAAVIARRHGAEDPLVVLCPDDGGWHPEILPLVLHALEEFPGQVILCAPESPAVMSPAWTTIDARGVLGGAAASGPQRKDAVTTVSDPQRKDAVTPVPFRGPPHGAGDPSRAWVLPPAPELPSAPEPDGPPTPELPSMRGDETPAMPSVPASLGPSPPVRTTPSPSALAAAAPVPPLPDPASIVSEAPLLFLPTPEELGVHIPEHDTIRPHLRGRGRPTNVQRMLRLGYTNAEIAGIAEECRGDVAREGPAGLARRRASLEAGTG